MKKPYIKIRVKFGRSKYYEHTISSDEVENPEWWPIFTDELKIAFADEDMTSISIRRIKDPQSLR